MPLGSWHGVTTNGMGRVTGLALGGNGLSGSVPTALGQLTALTSLELDGNSGLTGSIPSAWTALTALTTLDLSGTGVCAPPDAAAITAWLDAIRTGRYAVTVTLVHAAPTPEPSAELATAQLEAALTTGGGAFVRWRGAETPVAETVRGLSRRVTAVYRWDAPAQAWRSWFPGASGIGVNTLATLQPGAIYFVFAE